MWCAKSALLIGLSFRVSGGMRCDVSVPVWLGGDGLMLYPGYAEHCCPCLRWLLLSPRNTLPWRRTTEPFAPSSLAFAILALSFRICPVESKRWPTIPPNQSSRRKEN